MPKELLKKYPCTSAAIAVVSLLVGQSLLVGDDSLITNAMIQASWCAPKNYICLISHYACVSITIMIFCIAIDFGVKLAKKASNRKKIISTTSVNAYTSLPEIVTRFSSHLEEITRGKDITGIGLDFLSAIKSAPPFLGIDHPKPIISKPDEKVLTEFFRAQRYVENNRDAIRGGRYGMKHGDNREIVAQKVYGDTKFSNLVNSFTFPNGSIIKLPYLNINSLNDSSEFIERQISINEDKHKIETLLRSYNLVEDEAIQLLRMIYDAAQKTLNDGKK